MERAAIWLSWDSPLARPTRVRRGMPVRGGAAFFLLCPLVPLVPLRGAYLGRTPFLGSSAKSFAPPPTIEPIPLVGTSGGRKGAKPNIHQEVR